MNSQIETKKTYLKSANILVRSYIHFLLDSLYIEVDDDNKGIANEMIKQDRLFGHCFEATISLAPFFKDQDEIIRGEITNLEGEIIPHSWLRFNLIDEDFILDPELNIIVPKTIYDEVFVPNEIAKISAGKIKEDILNILDSNKKTEDNWHIIEESNNINNSFYKSSMYIKGEKIKKKLLNLTTRYHNN